MSELTPAACACPFVSHHRGPCAASGIFAIGKETRVTLCRACLEHLLGQKEAARRMAGAVHRNLLEPRSAGPVQPKASSQVATGFRFG